MDPNRAELSTVRSLRNRLFLRKVDEMLRGIDFPLFTAKGLKVFEADRKERQRGSVVGLSHRTYLSISFRVSSPPQNRQIILYDYQLEYEVDGFVGELTF